MTNSASRHSEHERQYIARNRRARHDYELEEIIEAGIELRGSEVKSLRLRRASLNEAYAQDSHGEIFLLNAHISPYDSASSFGHEPTRARRLLLHRKEIARLIGAVRRKGMTLVPLSLYFGKRGRIKLELALARGRSKGDMRAAIKEREWKRQKQRLRVA